jgi:hypothetical protein
LAVTDAVVVVDEVGLATVADAIVVLVVVGAVVLVVVGVVVVVVDVVVGGVDVVVVVDVVVEVVAAPSPAAEATQGPANVATSASDMPSPRTRPPRAIAIVDLLPAPPPDGEVRATVNHRNPETARNCPGQAVITTDGCSGDRIVP